ncbi:MAG: hypothetical protein RIR64_1045 [Bacteroidota bacterium]
MKNNKEVVVLIGAGDSKNYVSWLIKSLYNYLLKNVHTDKTKMKEKITSSNLK